MRRADTIKTAQLIIFAILAAVCVFAVIIKGYDVRVTGILMLISLALEFFFIFVDFLVYEKQQNEYNRMMETMRSDPITSMANRYSVDALIDKFNEQVLPQNFACIAFEISNIKDINVEFGRKRGNDTIRQFSNIMKMAALDKYFIGRNGGNRFIAMTEDGDDSSIHMFIQRITEKVEEYNQTPGNPTLHIQHGLAYHEQGTELDLIAFVALANRRIGEKNA